MDSYTIVPARAKDLPHLAAIELAAARLLDGYAPASVLNETTSQGDLQQAVRDGRLWVVLFDDGPVGFAHVERLDIGAAHLEEIDVHPSHARRGLGTRLVERVCRWAAAVGFTAVTLTTFRDVPWNMPFYERLGFRVVGPREMTPALRARVDDEARRGLDPSTRVVMKRFCDVLATTGMGMSEIELVPVDPTPDDVQFLEDRIYEFNSRATGIVDGQWLAFFVREGDRIVAGICGNTWGGTCELRQFWVDESRRRRGLGTRLLRAAEREAQRRGCSQIVLMTFSFQAPALYARHGFEVVASLDDHPSGHRNLLMRKQLAQAGSA